MVVCKSLLVGGLVIVKGRLSKWRLKFYLIKLMNQRFTYPIYTIEIHIFTQEYLCIMFIVNNHIGKISRVDIPSLKVDAANSFDLHLDHLTVHTIAPNYLAYFQWRLLSRSQTLVAANIHNKFEDSLRILHWATFVVVNRKLLHIWLVRGESLTVLRIMASIVRLISSLWVTSQGRRSHVHLLLVLGFGDKLLILLHGVLHLTRHFLLHLSFGEDKILIWLKLLLSSLLHLISSSVLLWQSSKMPIMLRHSHRMIHTMLILHHVMLIILTGVPLKIHI